MKSLLRLAITAVSLLALSVAAGCGTTVVDRDGSSDDGFVDESDGADDYEDGDEHGLYEDDDDGDDDGDDGEDDGTSSGPGPAGSNATCDPAATPDAAACDGSVVPIDLDRAQATVAIVGRWLRCNTEVEGLFPEGVVVFPEGRLKLLHQEDGQLVCREGFDEGGDWLLEDHCGIGMCDDYSMQLSWDGGSWSSMSLLFANDGDYLRIVNGAGENEEYIRIP